jgi:hypothetical protein
VVAVRVAKATGRIDWIRSHADDMEACHWLPSMAIFPFFFGLIFASIRSSRKK